VRRDFGAAADAVLARLASLDPPLAGKQSRERIQAAIVLLAGGDPAELERAAALAEIDWRDVLVAAGLAHEDWPERLDAELGA
jgi:hypothetical protein